MAPQHPTRRVDDLRRDLARRARKWTVEELHDLLAAEGIRRLFVVYENGELTLSHPRILAPLKAFFELSQDFAQHEGVFIGREDGIPTLFFAFVHDTRRGLSQGGLRFDRYDNVAQVLVDGLRLSQGMTRKNALAGLRWGGGKGIIPITPAIDNPGYVTTPADGEEPADPRRRLFRAYGRFIASLGGVYYTAEDVGTNTPDLDAVLACNRFTTCISPELGGSGNPSPATARGVFRAMEAAWLFLTGSRRLQGVRVAVQGAGHVGAPLIELLDDAGAEVWLCDTQPEAIRRITDRRPGVHVVEPAEIYDQDVDVFAPCAIGATVNAETIPRFAERLRLICGAANNILREKADADRLRERKIAFVPDFVCNRMGITNCADEWLGYLQEDIQVAAERVFPDSLRVLKHARSLAITTTEAADQLADIAASELHPQLGHRGRRLIDHLIASRWHREGAGPRHRLGERPFEPVLHEPDIRLEWERARRYRGRGPRIAAAPITTASRPNLATVFSATLMDVQARAVEVLRGEAAEASRPHRILGSDHGGLALQLAVERAIPNERDEVGRPQFFEMCRDVHNKNDAAIREQLHQLGVGFDPQGWLDPMTGDGPRVSERLFYALQDAGVVARENRHAHRCPHCRTVLMDPEVVATELHTDCKYRILFRTLEGAEIETFTFDPTLVLGMVAVAVREGGELGDLAGQTVRSPLGGAGVPVIAVRNLAADAEFIVPSHSRQDYRIAHQHGIHEHPPVYGDHGQVRLADGRRLAPEAAREQVLEELGAAVSREEGRWTVDAHRCRRCEEVVHPSFSPQLYVHFDAARTMLRQKIDNGSVSFSHPEWRQRVLDYLDELEPWCISRQIWWGNPIPGSPDEVLSTWFSLAAWSLQGAGWPEDPAPAPIDQVFTDPDLLFRWIVPSQLVALQVTGRPVFRRIQVHGSVHVVERRRAPRRGVADREPDEERFLFRTVRRPMRRRLGNVVEPATLIRRFGADALRLGFLLCLGSGFQPQAVASETRFRRARRALHRFVSKLDGLVSMAAANPRRCGEPRLADRWIVARSAAVDGEVRKAYEESRLADAAELLLGTLEAYARYANVAAERRRGDGDLGAILAASAGVVGRLRQLFSPICPFVFEWLDEWLAKRLPEGTEVPPVEAGLPELVQAVAGGREAVEAEASDAARLCRRQGDREELARLARVPAPTLPPYVGSSRRSAAR